MRRTVEVFDNRLDFPIGEQRIISCKVQSRIQEGMAIKNARFWPRVMVRTAIPARVSQLQADDKAVIRASSPDVFLPENGPQLP
jgi:hypothetical protein